MGIIQNRENIYFKMGPPGKYRGMDIYSAIYLYRKLFLQLLKVTWLLKYIGECPLLTVLINITLRKRTQ